MNAPEKDPFREKRTDAVPIDADYAGNAPEHPVHALRRGLRDPGIGPCGQFLFEKQNRSRRKYRSAVPHKSADMVSARMGDDHMRHVLRSAPLLREARFPALRPSSHGSCPLVPRRRFREEAHSARYDPHRPDRCARSLSSARRWPAGLWRRSNPSAQEK